MTRGHQSLVDTSPPGSITACHHPPGGKRYPDDHSIQTGLEIFVPVSLCVGPRAGTIQRCERHQCHLEADCLAVVLTTCSLQETQCGSGPAES